MNRHMVAFLLTAFTWTNAFIFFAKPAFAIQPNRHISSRSIEPIKPKRFSERTVPICCQPENEVESDSDSSSELEPNNLVETEPAREILLKERLAAFSNEVDEWENKLRLERIKLNSMEDKLSESGKNGYYLVQAQLQDFRRKVELDQKKKVSNDRRDYILKVLPLMDAMRDAPQVAPASTPRGESMHESYQSLLTKMLELFEKYGYKEFSAASGDSLDPKRHQIAAVLEPTADADSVAEGTILYTTRLGVQDENNKILRKALVAVAGTSSVPAQSATNLPEVSEEGDGEDKYSEQ